MGAFCNTFDLHSAIIGLEMNFGILFEWPLKTGFTVICLTVLESFFKLISSYLLSIYLTHSLLSLCLLLYMLTLEKLKIIITTHLIFLRKHTLLELIGSLSCRHF